MVVLSSQYLCPEHPISSRILRPLQAFIKEKEVALYALQKQSARSAAASFGTAAHDVLQSPLFLLFVLLCIVKRLKG
ncbi:hypothetical protein [Flavisolibacter tropicus]|uniref:Uncharacterized protein n=1 Tax=Flavisolibacter tropicus TaxID=1492898 RepID=A0A172TZT8_9BACT|nr:hypothetical protein [Flavisolibacter tropicus]ANE52293.1 hypothetical protein SY85_19190 [Flavisolibacter tropicus]